MSVLSKDVKEDWKDEAHEEDTGGDFAGVNTQKGRRDHEGKHEGHRADIYEGRGVGRRHRHGAQREDGEGCLAGRDEILRGAKDKSWMHGGST